jgi:hypothetical protein
MQSACLQEAHICGQAVCGIEPEYEPDDEDD